MALRRISKSNRYRATSTFLSEVEILKAAEEILMRRSLRLGQLTTPSDSISFLRPRLGGLDHEEFHVVWLDSRHRILAVEKLFTGTIDGSAVRPREVVKAALARNAAAAILAHNHPSGMADPSQADKEITAEIAKALRLVGVRVIDHIVVTCSDAIAFSHLGLL